MFGAQKPDESFFAQEIMTKRPEQLTIRQFVDLTNQVHAILGTA